LILFTNSQFSRDATEIPHKFNIIIFSQPAGQAFLGVRY
jgi:hypothetical protein